jgi:hypothetical protein
MLFFKPRNKRSWYLLIFSQVFCLSAIVLDTWMSWHYRLDWPKTQVVPVENNLKTLNLTQVMQYLLQIVEFIPPKIKIQKLIFLDDEFRLIGLSTEAVRFTKFCEGLRRIMGLQDFQILNWQEQVFGLEKGYRFVMVWRLKI